MGSTAVTLAEGGCPSINPISPKQFPGLRIASTASASHTSINTLRYRVDVNTLHRIDAPTLSLNEIGRVQISLNEPTRTESGVSSWTPLAMACTMCGWWTVSPIRPTGPMG